MLQEFVPTLISCCLQVTHSKGKLNRWYTDFFHLPANKTDDIFMKMNSFVIKFFKELFSYSCSLGSTRDILVRCRHKQRQTYGPVFLSATEFSVADYNSTPCGVVIVVRSVVIDQIKKWIIFWCFEVWGVHKKRTP